MNPRTFTLEEYAGRSFNYFSRMVDDDHRPYFHIFWTDGAEAAHDYPDWSDVMTRQFQAAIMGKKMTGKELPIEKIWFEKILSLLDSQTGLIYHPETSFDKKEFACPGAQALTMYALLTAQLEGSYPDLRAEILKMVDHLPFLLENSKPQDLCWDGFLIKSLMVCGRQLNHQPAIDLAGKLVRQIFTVNPLFSPDNTFRHGGHMHANLRILSGAADYALQVKDPVLYGRIDSLYRYVRSEATRFGFLPEVIGRTGDVVACETCALADYLALAVTLANHGHPEYWSDVERVVRNHLVESQVVDGSWLVSDSSRADTAQFSWREIGERMIGGYAGWSSPNHILAARETLKTWGGSELKGKTRAFQNCCGGSGTQAFFIAWKNSARFDQGCLNIHLHFDKLLPQAEIRSYQPYQGLLRITLKEPCEIKLRVPEFIQPQEMQTTFNGRPVKTTLRGNYLEIPHMPAGTVLEIRYPLPVYQEEVSVGNPGGRHYTYRVTWKGDTVTGMEPTGTEWRTGYSDFDGGEVQVFYGKEGPGLLYQRNYMLESANPTLSEIQLDPGGLDFWLLS
jgi:hypothetical protein